MHALFIRLNALPVIDIRTVITIHGYGLFMPARDGLEEFPTAPAIELLLL